VTINPELADIVPWKNRQLATEKLSRASSMALLFTGIGITLIIFLFLVFQFILTNTLSRNLQKVREETDQATNTLILGAYQALQSDSIKHMVRIQEMLDELGKIDGTLVKYQVENGQVLWEVLMPQTYVNTPSGTIKGEVVVTNTKEPDGRVRVRGTR
jgi:hypothetical protein